MIAIEANTPPRHGSGKSRRLGSSRPLATEQIRHWAAMTQGEQLRVNPMLQRRALTHQIQPPASPLALLALLKRRQPNLRD